MDPVHYEHLKRYLEAEYLSNLLNKEQRKKIIRKSEF